jgi:hypothetical protein
MGTGWRGALDHGRRIRRRFGQRLPAERVLEDEADQADDDDAHAGPAERLPIETYPDPDHDGPAEAQGERELAQ